MSDIEHEQNDSQDTMVLDAFCGEAALSSVYRKKPKQTGRPRQWARWQIFLHRIEPGYACMHACTYQ